jgi:26S proteasome regulatory subunit N10
MILLDNSEYMRNGDYIPTRLEAQQDAANLLVSAKTQSHPESTVGISAGTELLVSPTDDVGKILNALHEVPLKKQENVTFSMQVASLALKHRRNKNGAQRIVLFVGSPLTGIEIKTLQKAGRQLKKRTRSQSRKTSRIGRCCQWESRRWTRTNLSSSHHSFGSATQ